MLLQRSIRCCFPLALFAVSLPLQSADDWLRLTSPHFEILTTAPERDARQAVPYLELLHRFFLTQTPLSGDSSNRVRIIAFRSAAEYAPYQLNNVADAYNVGSGGRDWIVLPSLGARSLGMAAHEYAHVAARRKNLKLPPWLGEGLAEVFSTIVFDGKGATFGRARPEHLRLLSREHWLPFADLMRLREVDKMQRSETGIFYAESWAVAHMLVLSPAYRSRLSDLLSRPDSVEAVYAEPLDDIEHNVREWMHARRLPETVVAGLINDADLVLRVEPLPPFDAQSALAEMLSDSGRQTDASAAWLHLEAIRPSDPRVQAALGRIALLRKQTAEARKRYQRALALGIRDARLCTDFGILAHDAGFPENEVQAAFERALKLDPSMDDARYQLAMLHMNAGRYAAALPYFQALHDVPKSRAFAYYTALANTQLELGMRKETEASAAQARKYAETDEEREFASELVWMAKSELVVQMSPTGPARFRRIPLREGREPEPVNPFIAPGDRIERREGTLEAVDCSAPELRLTVSTGQDRVVLSLPDLGRVQVRKAGSTVFEFTCGTEEHRNVLVEYAVQPNAATGVAGLLRGIELR